MLSGRRYGVPSLLRLVSGSINFSSLFGTPVLIRFSNNRHGKWNRNDEVKYHATDLPGAIRPPNCGIAQLTTDRALSVASSAPQRDVYRPELSWRAMKYRCLFMASLQARCGAKPSAQTYPTVVLLLGMALEIGRRVRSIRRRSEVG